MSEWQSAGVQRPVQDEGYHLRIPSKNMTQETDVHIGEDTLRHTNSLKVSSCKVKRADESALLHCSCVLYALEHQIICFFSLLCAKLGIPAPSRQEEHCCASYDGRKTFETLHEGKVATEKFSSSTTEGNALGVVRFLSVQDIILNGGQTCAFDD